MRARAALCRHAAIGYDSLYDGDAIAFAAMLPLR